MAKKRKRTEKAPERKPRRWPLYALLVYVAVVHIVDTLAHQNVSFGIDWRMFRWQSASGFDVFEFLFWLLIPMIFILALRRVGWGYFGFGRWKRIDWILLVVFAGIGLLAILAIPLFPSLKRTYASMGAMPDALKWETFRYYLVWNFSWILGWEFIHRCAMLVLLKERWPKHGWVLIPLAETAYHLQKPWPEMLAMAVFSVVATQWAMRRDNMLLPLLVHLAVEIELVAFLLLV